MRDEVEIYDDFCPFCKKWMCCGLHTAPSVMVKTKVITKQNSVWSIELELQVGVVVESEGLFVHPVFEISKPVGEPNLL